MTRRLAACTQCRTPLVELTAGDDELVEVALAVARSEVAAEALAIWLRQRGRRLER